MPVLWWAEQPELVLGKLLDLAEPAKTKAKYVPNCSEKRVLVSNLVRRDGLDRSSWSPMFPFYSPPPSQLHMLGLLSEEWDAEMKGSHTAPSDSSETKICCFSATNSLAF